VFDAAKALFLCRGDELATLQETGSRIPMIGIDPENDHEPMKPIR